HTYSSYIEKQYDFLKLLVENGIIDCLHESIYDSFVTCEHFLQDKENPSRIYAADFVAQGITSIAKNYVLYGPVHNPEYLGDMIYSLLSGSFFM
ncbi:MAG: TetR/AcrR family transcriptional regulator, partial [Eubacteriales bacterium]|nr:TetR/AcrR family transcriptional regulator [Eubacteriales bacterium]